MKKLLISVLIVLSFDLVAQDYTHYKIAFERFISTSKAYKSQSCYRREDFVIMEEIVPFDKMSFLFQSQIDSLKKLEIHWESNTRVLSYKSLRIGKKRSKMKLFFSAMKDEIFFAEATCTRNKAATLYKSLSPFGMSIVFMFRVTSQGEVELIKVSEIANL